MKRYRQAAAVFLLVAASHFPPAWGQPAGEPAAAGATAVPGPSSSGSGGSVVRQGIDIDLSVVPLEDGVSVREEEYATVRLKLADANTGVKDLKTGGHPVSMAYSELSKSVYVAHEGDGAVVAIDGKRHEISGRMQLEPGLKVLRLAPGGHWGFVANALTSTVSVFDASGTTVTYTGQIGNGPDHISFSQEFAYVRSRGTAEVIVPQGWINLNN